MSSASLHALNYNISQFIQPRPLNYKLIRSSNSSSSNMSSKMRHSQILILDGQSQHVNRSSRFSGKIQFGNAYLGQPINLNSLGKTQGMPNGSGGVPTNKFY